MEYENVKKAVCLIQSTGEGNQVFKGTGFHFGRRWIMSVAHNFQDGNETDETLHNIMREGKFKVTWNGCTFEENKRMAFVHRLKPGEYPNLKNRDIAMFRLGIQYEYGRNKENYTPWEKSEDGMLESMDATSCAIANAQFNAPSPQVGENVYAFHYGGGNNTLQVEQPIRITKITPGIERAPLLHLEKFPGALPHGSSGCPVMTKGNEKYYLAGLHFAGHADEKYGTSLALPWNAIREYIDKGKNIIAELEKYMACSENEGASFDEAAKESKSRLISEAREANLSIYLCNGEVFK